MKFDKFEYSGMFHGLYQNVFLFSRFRHSKDNIPPKLWVETPLPSCFSFATFCDAETFPCVFPRKISLPPPEIPPFSGKSIGWLHRPQVCQQGWGKTWPLLSQKSSRKRGRCNLRLFGKKWVLWFFPGNSRFVASPREVEAFFSKFAMQCYARMMKRGMREALQDSSRGQWLTIATGKLEKSMIK